MFEKKFLSMLIAGLALGAVLWAGDTATFVDLGFSPDGRTYMFAQYGVQSGALKPWADLFVVDVPRNNFVSGGKFSYTHDKPVVAGQDGSGALYRIIAKNSATADRYGVSFLFQGQALYISLDGSPSSPGEPIEFRDFETGTSYRATLVPSVEGSGTGMQSSFYIDLERTGKDGSKKRYTVGTPQLKRPLIASYRIRKVMIAPQDGSMILVIEMKKQNGADYDIRYMVEALRL
jgi:predicted secreted protein